MPTTLALVVDGFCYGAAPTTVNQTGVRNFGGDASGRVCQDIATPGVDVCTSQPGPLPGSMAPTCTVIQ
jgi:hypothetical protein